jgi:hypothetical protein
MQPQPSNYLLVGAVLLFTLSYYYQVPQNPPGFYIDEASIAYNAYTISQTGQDEYGENWPLYFKAFGEYKNPVYIYLLSILFRVFGPSMLVARIFSATLTVIAIGIIWLLSFRLSGRKNVAFVVALSALLTPWLFENSRLVFEVALYPTLVALFLFVVFSASRKERWGVVEAIPLTLLLSLLSYSASVGRLFAPLLALGLLFFATRRRLIALVATWLVFAASLVPGVVYNQQHGGALMFRFWLLSYVSPEKPIGEIVGTFLRQYIANVNPWTIAITGENNVRDHVGTMGSILLPSLLLALAGIVYVIRYHRKESWWRFMLYALAVAPIPASLTTTQFPQIRLVALPVLLHVFMVPSVSWLMDFDRGKSRKIILGGLMLIAVVQGVVYRAQFRKAGPERWYIFDEQFPREVLPTALSQNRWPIYFHDPPTKSGYAELYWYGTLMGLSADKFVRLSGDEKAPEGAVVISTAEECSDCRLLLKSINYIVYISGKGKGK